MTTILFLPGRPNKVSRKANNLQSSNVLERLGILRHSGTRDIRCTSWAAFTGLESVQARASWWRWTGMARIISESQECGVGNMLGDNQISLGRHRKTFQSVCHEVDERDGEGTSPHGFSFYMAQLEERQQEIGHYRFISVHYVHVII